METVRRAISWAVGWGVSLPLVVFGIMLSASRLSLVAPVVTVAAASGFGLPALVAARLRGSLRPRGEAAVWACGFALSSIVLYAVLGPSQRLASPDEVNSVTTEEMTRRNESVNGLHYPKGSIEVVGVLLGCACLCGFTSGSFLNSGSSLTGRTARSVGASAATVAGMMVALLSLPFVAPLAERIFSSQMLTTTPFLGPFLGSALSGSIAGFLFGMILEGALKALAGYRMPNERRLNE